MAEQGSAEAVDVEHDALAEGGDEVTLGPGDALRGPRAASPGRILLLRVEGDAAVVRGDDLAVGVPAHEVRASAELHQALEGRARERPARDVAAHHDPVRLLALELGEHRVESRDVAVDVVERCDAHGPVAKIVGGQA